MPQAPTSAGASYSTCDTVDASLPCLLTRGVHGLHSLGVQEGVQTCGFTRESRWAWNSMVAPFQFLPATMCEVPGHR